LTIGFFLEFLLWCQIRLKFSFKSNPRYHLCQPHPQCPDISGNTTAARHSFLAG